MTSTVGVTIYAWRARAGVNRQLPPASRADAQGYQQLEETVQTLTEQVRRLEEQQSFTTALLSERSVSAEAPRLPESRA